MPKVHITGVILIKEGWVKNKINAKGSNKQYICGDCSEKRRLKETSTLQKPLSWAVLPALMNFGKHDCH